MACHSPVVSSTLLSFTSSATLLRVCPISLSMILIKTLKYQSQERALRDTRRRFIINLHLDIEPLTRTLSASIPPIPYPLNTPAIKSISFQLGDEDVLWECFNDLTEVGVDDMGQSSLADCGSHSIIKSHQIGQVWLTLKLASLTCQSCSKKTNYFRESLVLLSLGMWCQKLGMVRVFIFTWSFFRAVPHTIKPLEVGQSEGSAGRRQQESCLRSLPPAPPCPAAFTGSCHTLHQPQAWGIHRCQSPGAPGRCHGRGWQAGQLWGAASTWCALLLVPGHPQPGSISQRLSAVPGRKCCFPLRVAMVMGKQAPIQVLGSSV